MFSIESSQTREPALCQLYRHTVVPYACDTKVSQRQAGFFGTCAAKCDITEVRYHRD